VWNSGSKFATDVPFPVEGVMEGRSRYSYIMRRTSKGRRSNREAGRPLLKAEDIVSMVAWLLKPFLSFGGRYRLRVVTARQIASFVSYTQYPCYTVGKSKGQLRLWSALFFFHPIVHKSHALISEC